jgi:hypothetical protein
MSFMIGLIIFGNIVDNVSHPKWVAIFVQLTISVSWGVTGLLVYHIATFETMVEVEQTIKDSLF